MPEASLCPDLAHTTVQIPSTHRRKLGLTTKTPGGGRVSEDLGPIPSTQGGSRLHVIIASADLTPSSGLPGHCAHKVQRHTRRQNSHTS